MRFLLSTDKWKLALIPVLCGVLLYAVFGGGNGSKKQENESVPLNTTDLSHPFQRDSLKAAWQAMDLEEIRKYDPFARPPSLSKEAQEEAQKKLAVAANPQPVNAQQHSNELTETIKVMGVLIDAQGKAAIVNSKLVREGELLREGLRVIRIENGSIVVRTE